MTNYIWYIRNPTRKKMEIYDSETRASIFVSYLMFLSIYCVYISVKEGNYVFIVYRIHSPSFAFINAIRWDHAVA